MECARPPSPRPRMAKTAAGIWRGNFWAKKQMRLQRNFLCNKTWNGKTNSKWEKGLCKGLLLECAVIEEITMFLEFCLKNGFSGRNPICFKKSRQTVILHTCLVTAHSTLCYVGWHHPLEGLDVWRKHRRRNGRLRLSGPILLIAACAK